MWQFHFVYERWWITKTITNQTTDEGWINYQGISSKVWIYNPQKKFERKPGPSLNQSREKHSCSILRNEEKTQIVVAGGYGKIGTDTVALNSVEIYDPIDRTWHFGNYF